MCAAFLPAEKSETRSCSCIICNRENSIFCILGLFVEIVVPKCDLFHHTMYRGIYSFKIIRLVRVSPFKIFCNVKLERIRHTIYERKFFLVPQYIFAGKQINRSSVHDRLQNRNYPCYVFLFSRRSSREDQNRTRFYIL